MTVPHHLSNAKKGHGWESHVGPILGKQKEEVHQNLWRERHVTLKKKEKKKGQHIYHSDSPSVKITE